MKNTICLFVRIVSAGTQGSQNLVFLPGIINQIQAELIGPDGFIKVLLLR